METIIKSLNKLKDEIDQSKKKLSQLEGRKDEILRVLREEFGVSSFAEAEKKLSKDSDRLSKLRVEIEADYKKLSTKFDW